ncbi:serine/threonine protein kinase [Microbispora amethystogenes]|uniref:Protein kinase domain-containing protein n=1 Tax=Microbispora amethystogenes TaxID=1427754 RepID=A0ABQ4FMX2_9ACTN|nr:serine/threonine-protein kinase [Microbispora amethystogenes]GIH36159.1 hypothetical protein Mam01_63230 [Microbispora amethystogenes]
MPQPLEPGDPGRLGSYRITGRIGEGGQGVVYLGEGESGGLVAVKLFHARLGGDAAAHDAFVRETELARRVARFCTAQVLESGVDGGRPYIVSEYVQGHALSQVVAAHGPMSGGALERLAIATATALVALHDAGVVHRDFKPHNVLIGPDGPRVIDFGIARALVGTSTVTSQVVGTPAYMAPEQFTAGELGFALDVFAWASTMVFAATGRAPFGADAIPAIINRILNQEPDLDGVEAPLRDLLTACLAKNPDRRPAAREILDRLVRPRHDAPSVPTPAAPTPSVPTPAAPTPATLPPVPSASGPVVAAGRSRRGRVVGTAVAAVVVVAALVAAVALLPSLRRPSAGSGPSLTERAAAAGTAPAAASAGTGGGASPSGAPSRTTASRSASPASSPASSPRPRVSRPTAGPVVTRPGPTRTITARPTVRRSKTATPVPADPPASRSPKPSPAPALRLVELGGGHFTEYCVSLGWEWVEYRESPTPGAYCVKRKGDTMYLSQSQRDAGCRWRFHDPKAFHRFKGKSNYCYAYR